MHISEFERARLVEITGPSRAYKNANGTQGDVLFERKKGKEMRNCL